MTNCTSHSADPRRHASTFEVASDREPGVRLTIRRVSFAGRMELARMIRTLDRRLEFLQSSDDALSKVETAILSREIDQIYLRWGLAGVSGLEIDGKAATPESLIESGPEGVTQEALEAIRAECSLSPEERKN